MNGGKRLLDHGSWGWWDEPTTMKDIAQMKKLIDKQFEKPYHSVADVLLVHDTRTFYHMGSDRSTSYMGHWTNNWIPPAIYKSGVIHDVIHIDDLNRIDPDQYKIIVFVNTWMMTDAMRTLVKNRIAKKNRHLVFLYAPAYSNGKELNEKNIDDITGMHVIRLTDSSSVINVNKEILPEQQITVWNRKVSPLWSVDDRSVSSLGSFPNGKVGFARKKLKNSTSWFMALPSANAALWRYIFREAGANIYSDKGDVLYGGSGIIAIHTNEGGVRSIRFKNNTTKNISLAPFSTTLMDSETGEILLPNK
jgi:hypothetical protein